MHKVFWIVTAGLFLPGFPGICQAQQKYLGTGTQPGVLEPRSRRWDGPQDRHQATFSRHGSSSAWGGSRVFGGPVVASVPVHAWGVSSGGISAFSVSGGSPYVPHSLAWTPLGVTSVRSPLIPIPVVPGSTGQPGAFGAQGGPNDSFGIRANSAANADSAFVAETAFRIAQSPADRDEIYGRLAQLRQRVEAIRVYWP
jgi:hypothetical protein